MPVAPVGHNRGKRSFLALCNNEDSGVGSAYLQSLVPLTERRASMLLLSVWFPKRSLGPVILGIENQYI